MINEAIRKEGEKQQQQKLTKVVDRLKAKNGVNMPNMWEIKKMVERRNEEPVTAIKSKEGDIIEEPQKIRERYLEHFGEILQNVPAETEEEKAQEQLIEEVFRRMMLLADKKDTRLTTKEELQTASKKLKRKKCKDKSGWNNEMVLETGDEILECLLEMISKMERDREVPGD